MNKKKFIAHAKNVIDLEIKALQKLKKNLNSSFGEAVNQISRCQSKVILCGVGKSGLIASKIAATFASVGTPAFNLSASEASHGDLGMIDNSDIVIMISNSGETQELVQMAHYCCRERLPIILLTNQSKSTIANLCTCIIIISIKLNYMSIRIARRYLN